MKGLAGVIDFVSFPFAFSIAVPSSKCVFNVFCCSCGLPAQQPCQQNVGDSSGF
jgi:hypothetical protein